MPTKKAALDKSLTKAQMVSKPATKQQVSDFRTNTIPTQKSSVASTAGATGAATAGTLDPGTQVGL